MKLDAFGERRTNLLGLGGHLAATATIEEMDLAGPCTQSRTGRIQSGAASTNDRHIDGSWQIG